MNNETKTPQIDPNQQNNSHNAFQRDQRDLDAENAATEAWTKIGPELTPARKEAVDLGQFVVKGQVAQIHIENPQQ